MITRNVNETGAIKTPSNAIRCKKTIYPICITSFVVQISRGWHRLICLNVSNRQFANTGEAGRPSRKLFVTSHSAQTEMKCVPAWIIVMIYDIISPIRTLPGHTCYKIGSTTACVILRQKTMAPKRAVYAFESKPLSRTAVVLGGFAPIVLGRDETQEYSWRMPSTSP